MNLRSEKEPDEITVSIPASVLMEFDNKFASIPIDSDDARKKWDEADKIISPYLGKAAIALGTQKEATESPVVIDSTTAPVDNAEPLESRIEALEKGQLTLSQTQVAQTEEIAAIKSWLGDIEKRIDSMEKAIKKNRRNCDTDSDVIDDIHRELTLLSERVDTNEMNTTEGMEVYGEKIAAVEAILAPVTKVKTFLEGKEPIDIERNLEQIYKSINKRRQ